jgi:two-component system NarL family sensor kinase
LEVEVTDDGVGLPDTPDGGVGLSSMRERAAEEPLLEGRKE